MEKVWITHLTLLTARTLCAFHSRSCRGVEDPLCSGEPRREVADSTTPGVPIWTPNPGRRPAQEQAAYELALTYAPGKLHHRAPTPPRDRAPPVETRLTYIVVAVDKEQSLGRNHEHIAAVCTSDRSKYSRAQVIASVNAGNDWYTSAGGRSAKIIVVSQCGRCNLAPYIRTTADSTTTDNLLSLPAC